MMSNNCVELQLDFYPTGKICGFCSPRVQHVHIDSFILNTSIAYLPARINIEIIFIFINICDCFNG